MSTAKLLKVYKPGSIKLQKELELLHENLNVLHNFKEEIIAEIERKKLKLRQTTDCNKLYTQLKKYGKILEKLRFSTIIRDKLLKLLDK